MDNSEPLLDGDRMLREAQALAFPRYPATEGDRRAITWLRGTLEKTGLEVREEWFSYDLRPAWWILRGALAGSGLMLAAAGLVSSRSILLAAVLLLMGAGVGGALLAWAPWAERLYRRQGDLRTANVEARRRAPGRRLTLILLAHHDSKSQNLAFPARMGLTLLAIAGALGLSGLVVAGAFVGRIPGPAWGAGACGLLAGTALLVLSTLRSGNDSPGGVDNAGSVALLVELARCLPERVPEEVELVFLSPGAEEDHMVGAMRWLDAHLEELRSFPSYALNLDGAGNPGRVALLERYGFGKAFSKRLSRTAREAAAALGIPVRGVYLPPAVGLDSIPFAHRGVECLTLSSGSLNRATVAIHSAADRGENLERGTLERVGRLAVEIVERLAREVPDAL